MLKKLFKGPDLICPLVMEYQAHSGYQLPAACNERCAWLLHSPDGKTGACAIAIIANAPDAKGYRSFNVPNMKLKE